MVLSKIRPHSDEKFSSTRWMEITHALMIRTGLLAQVKLYRRWLILTVFLSPVYFHDETEIKEKTLFLKQKIVFWGFQTPFKIYSTHLSEFWTKPIQVFNSIRKIKDIKTIFLTFWENFTWLYTETSQDLLSTNV